jgi:transitional endoplasmic reticulum ATPase
MPLADDVDLEKIAKATDGFSGADIANLVREAGMYAIRQEEQLTTVKGKHFDAAMDKIKPSITPEMLKAYKEYIDVMSTKRDAIDTTPGPYT